MILFVRYSWELWFWRPDVWHKISEGRWKTCLWKTVLRNIEWLLAFFTFYFIESTHWLFYEIKTFILFRWIGRMGYQKSVFLYWFKKCTVHFLLSKKGTQKIFWSKNRFSWDLANFSIGKTVFWLKLFLCVHFYLDQLYIFEISMKDIFFDTPLAIFEEKMFSSLRMDNEYFLRTCRSKI